MAITGGGGLPFIGVKLRHSVDQAIVHNTYTFLTWDVEDFDAGDLHDFVTNPSRITIPVAGVYEVGFYIEWYFVYHDPSRSNILG